MTEAARHLIESFDSLADPDKQEVLAALLSQAIQPPYSGPSDDDLTAAADHVFQELDRRESDQ